MPSEFGGRWSAVTPAMRRPPALPPVLFSAALLSALFAALFSAAAAPVSVLDYIRQTWNTLTRSHVDLATAARDPKFPALPDGRWPVYVARSENLASIENQLRSEMPAAAFNTIELRPLPSDQNPIREHGLLYLPYSYVVPGGRFNEMYG